MSDEQQAPERDPLVKKFAYEWVCFNHDVNDKYPYLVTDITDDCMIELEGMSGLFAPSCFHLVPAPPTPGADGRYCRHHDDDPAHTKECYKPPADLAPVAQPPEHEGRIRRHEMTPERWEELQAALDRPTGPTDEEAEEVLQACGTSGKEVVNGFIERLLRENLELKRKLGSASLLPPSPQSEEIAKEIIQQLAPEANIHEGPHDFSLELWVDPLNEAIASALTAAQQRGSELQREVDAGIADIDLAALLDDLEAARDYLSRGPWEASEAAKERFKVRIANDAYECPEGSAQVRTTIDGDIPSKCLIPYGVIHYSDAEGIVLMRNRLEEMIRVVESAAAIRAAKQQDGIRR